MLRLSVNTRTLSAALQRFASTDHPRERLDSLRQLARRTLNEIVANTPVETGRARRSWIEAQSSLADPARHSAQSTELQATSRVPYMVFLEYGTRRIAPVAMVRQALAQARISNS